LLFKTVICFTFIAAACETRTRKSKIENLLEV
jgi:hypothetical protein